MKILLTGKTGQIGRELTWMLPRLGELFAMDRQQLDLTKPDEIRRVIRAIRPQVIVNSAAYTAVDQAEREQSAAEAINATAPGVLAEEARKIGTLLVHYSTDYVFDGSKRSPYTEADSPNPLCFYGRTKLMGEIAIQQCGVPYLIFRTEWVYAREGRNFLTTILRLATQREELRIVCDQIGAPTWSRQAAISTLEILSQVLARENIRDWQEISGTYHMTAAGETSWYQFANGIFGRS